MLKLHMYLVDRSAPKIHQALYENGTCLAVTVWDGQKANTNFYKASWLQQTFRLSEKPE